MRNVQHHNGEQNGEVDMGDNVAHKFDDGRAANAAVQREGEVEPGWRTNEHKEGESHGFAERPVDTAGPKNLFF